MYFSQFCTFCTILLILHKFVHFAQVCTFCTILHILHFLHNFADFAQFCTVLQILHVLQICKFANFALVWWNSFSGYNPFDFFRLCGLQWSLCPSFTEVTITQISLRIFPALWSAILWVCKFYRSPYVSPQGSASFEFASLFTFTLYWSFTWYVILL